MIVEADKVRNFDLRMMVVVPFCRLTTTSPDAALWSKRSSVLTTLSPPARSQPVCTGILH